VSEKYIIIRYVTMHFINLAGYMTVSNKRKIVMYEVKKDVHGVTLVPLKIIFKYFIRGR